jgi:hypothetical protein
VVVSRLRTPFGLKTAIFTDTTSFFPVENENEAHYLCGILNSEVVNEYISSFSSAGRGFGAPSVMNHLAIPKFNGNNRTHMKIAELSKKAHALVAQRESIEDLQNDLNEAVERLWNIKF